MSKLLFSLQVVLVLSLALFITSCGEDDPDPLPAPMTIADIVEDTERFSSLKAALERADLLETVRSGEYTVFAPDNDAFDTFLNGAALADVDIDVLTQTLLNHVIGAKVESTGLENGYVSTLATESTTENPISLQVNIDNGVKLNNTVSVIQADIAADNGIIHEVDAVIGVPSVVDLAVQGDFSILVAALTRADLTVDFVGTLSGTGPFTVFAPTDAAFVALLDSNNDWDELGDIPVATLEAVLSYHVVAGANVLSSTLTDGQVVTSFEGSDFTINTADGAKITDANGNTVNIVATDVQGANGVVHVIDGVILP
ncbi:MAG: fasciclin domain-containing protein [Saprospiraceae bacterium]